MARYRLLEHTSDIGIEARASTEAELFRQCALALREILFEDPPAVKPDIRRKVELRAERIEDLLVDWLNEILYLLEVHHLVPVEFLIERLDETHLIATIAGTSLETVDGLFAREVKSATYHLLEVATEPGRARCRVYLDL